MIALIHKLKDFSGKTSFCKSELVKHSEQSLKWTRFGAILNSVRISKRSKMAPLISWMSGSGRVLNAFYASLVVVCRFYYSFWNWRHQMKVWTWWSSQKLHSYLHEMVQYVQKVCNLYNRSITWNGYIINLKAVWKELDKSALIIYYDLILSCRTYSRRADCCRRRRLIRPTPYATML